ncbi:MAG: hypothetical protein WD768_04745 [Phycisphaeraceae bacterium]
MKPILFLSAAVLLATLSGCSAYKLQGSVIYGPRSTVEVVSSDDPRLVKGSPIEEAAILITLDPNSLRRKLLGQTLPNEKGQFAMVIDEPGAGLLEYEVQIICSAPGFTEAGGDIPLPGSNKRVLITLAPGSGRVARPDQLLEEFERNKRQFER